MILVLPLSHRRTTAKLKGTLAGEVAGSGLSIQIISYFSHFELFVHKIPSAISNTSKNKVVLIGMIHKKEEHRRLMQLLIFQGAVF